MSGFAFSVAPTPAYILDMAILYSGLLHRSITIGYRIRKTDAGTYAGLKDICSIRQRVVARLIDTGQAIANIIEGAVDQRRKRLSVSMMSQRRTLSLLLNQAGFFQSFITTALLHRPNWPISQPCRACNTRSASRYFNRCPI